MSASMDVDFDHILGLEPYSKPFPLEDSSVSTLHCSDSTIASLDASCASAVSTSAADTDTITGRGHTHINEASNHSEISSSSVPDTERSPFSIGVRIPQEPKSSWSSSNQIRSPSSSPPVRLASPALAASLAPPPTALDLGASDDVHEAWENGEWNGESSPPVDDASWSNSEGKGVFSGRRRRSRARSWVRQPSRPRDIPSPSSGSSSTSLSPPTRLRPARLVPALSTGLLPLVPESVRNERGALSGAGTDANACDSFEGDRECLQRATSATPVAHDTPVIRNLTTLFDTAANDEVPDDEEDFFS